MTTSPKIRRLEEIAREAARDADPAHDFGHVRRVASSARLIADAEGADIEVVLPAALLHELFSYPKDHPDSPRSGEVCAAQAEAVLAREGWPDALAGAVGACIRVHPFSRGLVPETLEGKVLQDADRLDALGAIGVARCFAGGGALGRPFYDPEDPFASARPWDDRAWTLDHFGKKLLKLPETLHTETAQAMAQERTAFLQAFLAQLAREVNT